MSTLEKLFVQIFERKNGIVDQVKEQADLYEQHLVAMLLINGIRPGIEIGSVDLEELKKEELISGLLISPLQPRIPPSGQRTLYNKPVIPSEMEHLTDGLFTETCASNKYINAGAMLAVIPKCHLNEFKLTQDQECTLNCAPELDFTTPSSSGQSTLYNKPFIPSDMEHLSDGLFSETCTSNKYFDTGARLIEIPKFHLNECKLTEECTLNRTPELDSIISSPQDQTGSRNAYFEPAQSLARIQRSISRQKALELCSSVKEKTRHPSKEVSASLYSGRITRSRASCQQPSSVKKLLELTKSFGIVNKGSDGFAQSKTGKCPTKGNDASVHFGRITRSRTSYKRKFKELLEMNNSSDNPDEGADKVDAEVHNFVAKDATRRSVVIQTATPNTGEMDNAEREAPYYLRSFTSYGKNIDCPKSGGSCITMKSVQSTKTVNNAIQGSWPQCKRRTNEGQSMNGLTASPRLRSVKQLQKIQEYNECRYLESVENGAEAVPELQRFGETCGMDVAQLNVAVSPDVKMHQSEKFHKTGRFESLTRLQVKEGKLDLEWSNQGANTTLTFNHKQAESSLDSSLKKEVSRDSHCLTDKVEMTNPTSIALNATWQSTSENYISNLDLGRIEQLHYSEGTIQESISFNKSDLSSTTTTGRVSVLEEIYRSVNILTPLPNDPMKYKFHTTPYIYQSSPNGLLEHMDPRITLLFNDDDSKKLKCSYNGISEELDHTFMGKSYSYCMPSSSVRSGRDVRRLPGTPPVGKLCPRITSKSFGGSSEKQGSINPELTCFRIEEDPSICEENADIDEIVYAVQEGFHSKGKNSLTNKEPLVDLTTNYLNPSASVSTSEKSLDRGSLDSVNAGVNFHQTQSGVKWKVGNCYGSNRRYKNNDKENQSCSLGGNGAWKATKSLHNRFSKPKLSRKASEGKRGQSFLENGCKHYNIVSNISSFIPIVKQKRQTAGVFTGKRDIKVKALEAARRLEERRDEERKMKKEAAKLEQARLEQENMRKLALKKKKKEEERVKKEADMAARKRLREEKEKKEKERKRECTEEGRRKQREHGEKLHAKKEEKEIRRQTTVEREHRQKGLANEARKYPKMEKEREGVKCRKKTGPEPGIAMFYTCDGREASNIHQDCQAPKESNDIEMEVCNLNNEHEGSILVTEGSRQQSYAISPYQGSDDEEDEEDVIPNQKIIPSWASENCLAQILPSLEKIDPDGIFPLASFCSIAKVLSPRKQLLN